jgi:hypothetical protein
VRPAWDIILIALMLGAFALSATGVYLAVSIHTDRVFLFLRPCSAADHLDGDLRRR